MKFVHIADCHVGGWREPKMRALNTHAFSQSIDYAVSNAVDFVIIAGDLFNNAFPGVDSLVIATKKLKELKDAQIPVYAIAGSHDFSPSGKTMLDVLEEAGLLINVAQATVDEQGKLQLKFTVDPKTGIKLTGLIGKKGGLDSEYYKMLAREPLEKEEGKKIFLFHCALTEMKPKELAEMDAMATSLLPAGFDYYAGGHVHVVDNKTIDNHQNIVFPGPTFPNNFAELEKLGTGTFVVVDDWNIQHVPIKTKPVITVNVDCNHKTAIQVQSLVETALENKQVADAIVLIRAKGTLTEGRPSDVPWNDILSALYAQGAYFVMKNTNKLVSPEYEEIKLPEQSIEQVEVALINQQAVTQTLVNEEQDKALIKTLIESLSLEKEEGEKSTDFEKRFKLSVDRILGVD